MNIKTLLTTLVIGLIASVAFIVIQPFFGMLTLTSRHAAVYVEVGHYSEEYAVILAWLLHGTVSIFYTFISLLIYNVNKSLTVSFLQIIILGWLTTLIATPANEWVIKLITTGEFTNIFALSDLNTEIGPKLWLHILFFALVVVSISLSRLTAFPKH
ncbi:hypothetical protein GCM10009111_08510 [Colwellia asteriadis]|uniref:DUF1772 domain-containing protein n=1 Tax=Colwellia asteriadis TaxID=517723 RepID=A0ABN1L4H9_9GAMM